VELRKPTGAQLQSLVGNPNVYALQHKDGSWHPVRERLTPAVIAKHRRGDITVGTYLINPPDQARTLVFDIDQEDEAEAQRQLQAVTAVLIDINRTRGGNDKLEWTTEWSGRRGWHIWLTASEYIDAEVLYRFGRGVVAEVGENIEVYPKQTSVRDLGNLVKLPGGKHQVTGKANDVLGEFGAPNDPEMLHYLAGLYPEVGVRSRKGDAPETIEYPCVHDIQEGVTHNRNIHLFQLATHLRRWSISDENVRLIVERANAAGDPLPQAEVDAIIENSRYSGPVCGQLDDDKHCGEQCILARKKGLHTRVGSLKWAAVGENVVVEVESRTDDGRVLEVSHPDAVQGRVHLKDPGRNRGE